MAGAGRRVFSPGEVLTASNTMNYLMDQSVMNFAGTAARGSAIGTAVAEGMVSYLQDTNTLQFYDGSAWQTFADDGGLPVANGGTGGTTVAAAQNNLGIGLIPITPTSVDKSGGTATTSGLGVVTFSGVNSVSLNGIFTTEYSRYRIQLNNFASSGNVLINFRGRTSGTDFTTANYYWSYVFSRVSTATPGGNGASSDSKLSIGGMNSPASSTCGGWIEIDRPKAANNKIVTGQFWGADGTGMIDINSGGIIYNTASFDGFTIYPNSGTLSGDIQVFAFND